MHFSMEKCITFELDFIRSKMTGWKVRKKKFAFFWVRHQNFLTLLFCSTCPISGKPPPGTGCPVEFFGFFGTVKFERVTPSNAFKITHRQNSREMTSDARVTHESSSQVPGGHFAARAKRAPKFPSAHFAKEMGLKKAVLTRINENLPTQRRVDGSLQSPNDREGCRRKLFNLIYILV